MICFFLLLFHICCRVSLLNFSVHLLCFSIPVFPFEKSYVLSDPLYHLHIDSLYFPLIFLTIFYNSFLRWVALSCFFAILVIIFENRTFYIIYFSKSGFSSLVLKVIVAFCLFVCLQTCQDQFWVCVPCSVRSMISLIGIVILSKPSFTEDSLDPVWPNLTSKYLVTGDMFYSKHNELLWLPCFPSGCLWVGNALFSAFSICSKTLCSGRGL